MSDHKLRVLLIEDDAGDAILVERTLQRCRQAFALQHSECLEDALDCLADSQFDVALLDLSLPDSFGLSGLDRVRERARDIPIVVLTGLADDDLALRSLEQGAQDYLVKGHTTAELLERTLRYAVQRQQIQTENHRLLERMEVLARQDPLTGVLNRHSFGENLALEWQRAERHHRPLSCVVLDIDFFKRINDTYGHATGDETLREVAKTLSSNSRVNDSVGRLGGEEFCVLLPETNEEDAIIWAEHIRHEIAALVISSDHDALHITASLGVAARCVDSSKAQVMVDQADEAMFVAKQLGRDQVISFGGLRRIGRPDAPQIWHGVTIVELATPWDVSLAPWQSMKEAIQLLGSGDADSVPVLSDEGELVGVIGQDDVMAATLTSGNLEGAVADSMQTQLVTFAPETVAMEVCEFLRRAAVRQVFVVDESGPIGVVRRTDFVRWLGKSIDGDATVRQESLPAMQDTLTQTMAVGSR